MRVLLTEGSGVTSRQAALRLHALGHRVGVLSSARVPLTRWTRAVTGWHRVPAFGADPVRWWQAALRVYHREGYDVLFPTQEQVTVLAWAAERGRLGPVRTAVPSFAALRRVQDKVGAAETLDGLGLPRPPCTVLHSPDDAWTLFPAYLKLPVATASAGVRRVADAVELRAALSEGLFAEALPAGVLVEQAVPGDLVMAQSVFDRGRLLAFHAARKTVGGPMGGASHKTSVHLPAARADFERLGVALGWHGALSADLILSGDGGHRFIDVNPRLVEPGNALHAGLDLVGLLLDLAAGGAPAVPAPSREGVGTHQVLLAVLGAAEHDRRRRAVWRQLADAARHAGPYRGGVEELTPLAGDPLALAPVAAAVLLSTLHPRLGLALGASGPRSYAISPSGWVQLTAG